MKKQVEIRSRTCSRLFQNRLKVNPIFSEWQMRMATTVHHTNPRSATLDFWRKTTKYDDYKVLQAKRRAQMNRPTRYRIYMYSKMLTKVKLKPPRAMVTT